jgi:hypothetical protein
MGASSKFIGQPTDPLEFLYNENWITLSSIGSIFTFALVANFRANVFDKIMGYILPIESFDFMKVELPDIGESPNINSMSSYMPLNLESTGNPNIIEFGYFVRESIIWIFMILFLYILAVFVRFPDIPGGNSSGSAIM